MFLTGLLLANSGVSFWALFQTLKNPFRAAYWDGIFAGYGIISWIVTFLPKHIAKSYFTTYMYVYRAAGKIVSPFHLIVIRRFPTRIAISLILSAESKSSGRSKTS